MSRNEKADLNVYVATHGPSCIGIKDYCVPLEIGAAVRANHCCELRDDIGADNISKKDLLYCEITGLYWIWKNNISTYVGLSHYRRLILDSQKKIIRKLQKKDALIVKTGRLPDTCENLYVSSDDHIVKDWEIMKEILIEDYPDYYQTAELFFKKKQGYKCNIIITRQELLNQYCSWLFPILFKIETKMDLSNRTKNQGRAIGYLCENLLGLYLVHNHCLVSSLHVLYLERKMPSFVPNSIAEIIHSHYWLHYYILAFWDGVCRILHHVKIARTIYYNYYRK